MWRNASENHAGSKTYLDVREGLGMGSLMGLASLTQAQLPQLLSLNSGLRGIPFSPFPERKHLQASSYTVFSVAGIPAFSSFSNTSFHL